MIIERLCAVQLCILNVLRIIPFLKKFVLVSHLIPQYDGIGIFGTMVKRGLDFSKGGPKAVDKEFVKTFLKIRI